ncbi:gustatory and odorant receptor 22-like [Diabrotica undecimpunctata]|uniref:gustatory and odorant receptor 22-like n=1 Tax=Diabrotica undecimpunctata TaxID=50387 RepID=UPI003B637F39
MEVSTFEELYEDELKTIGFKKFIRSARAQGIAKRAHLDSSDGQVIDDHDQFYRDHKLLLALFRILGVMPIQRGKIGKITFGWLSGPMIYAYVFYVITTVMVLLVGYERVDILLNKSRNLKFPHLSTLIVIISLGCLIVAVMLLLTLSALLDGFTLYHTTAYFHIITMINMNCALWYINCRAIGNASHALADSFQEVNTRMYSDIDQHCSAYMIANYRILWLELSELLQAIGNAYARTYATYSLFMITNITVAIYGFTSEVVDHGITFSFKEMGLLVAGLYCLTLLMIFCNCSHQASENIAGRIQTSLFNIRIFNVEQDTTNEIELFLTAIRLNPPTVSLKGFSDVNRRLVTSSIATIAIYLVILLQFKISLVNLHNP